MLMFEAVQLPSTCLWHMSGDHRVTEVLLETKYSQFIYYYFKYVHAAAHTVLHSLTALYMSKIGKKNVVHLDATWSHNICGQITEG